MINLKNYICALKSTWIRRLLANDSKYVSVFESKYTKIKDLINRDWNLQKGYKKQEQHIMERCSRILDSYLQQTKPN